MSRGGFRGRGRGGGGGGGIGRDFVVPTGSDMTKNDWIEAMKARPQHTGMLFPPLDSKNQAVLPAPDELETQTLEHASSIYALLHKGTDIPGHTAPTPWRMIGERKTVGIEIETYSGTHSDSSREKANDSNGEIDVASMYLDRSLFPPALWKEVFEGESMTEGNKRKREERAKQKRRKQLEKDDKKGEDKSEDEERSIASDDDNGEFDFEDDEEEDHQDYDANYFDNGEGDDDDDGVGDDEGGDGGGGNSWE